MPRAGRKEPLYRKVNTRALRVAHDTGGDYRHVRNARGDAAERGTMRGMVRRGLDYTPLFRFLLSKVGEPWDGVFAEAVARLDRPDPIFWVVARRDDERRPFVRVGESTYVSGLYVDDAGRLQRVDPSLTPERMEPSCTCCTHTLNGVRFG